MGDVIGYVAAGLFIISLLTPWAWGRAFLAIGLCAFIAHGVMIGSGPVTWGAAAMLIVVLAPVVRRLFTKPREATFGAQEMAYDAPFLADLLDKHAGDIHRHQPGFRAVVPGDLIFLLTCDGLPAGVVIGRIADGRYYVQLDYVIPVFRDNRLGTWFFGPGSHQLRRRGVSEVIAYPESDYHSEYLRAVGFHQRGEVMVRALTASNPLIPGGPGVLGASAQRPPATKRSTPK